MLAREAGPPARRVSTVGPLSLPQRSSLNSSMVSATGSLLREAGPSPSSPRWGKRKCARQPRRRTSSPTPPSTRVTWATSCLMEILRAAAARPPALAMPALQDLARHCARLLSARLEGLARAEDDWSIALPGSCPCPLCRRLAAFLAAHQERRLEWPLAEEARRHVHDRLDAHELPVRHKTRRTGRPYVLVLEKTETLFEREAAERQGWRADLEWLALPLGGGAAPSS